MSLNRRMLLSSLAASAAVGAPHLGEGEVRALGQTTPVAGEALPPEEILERLLATDFLSPLFPADYENLRVTEWIDEGDTDLEGAVGGVLYVTGTDDNNNPVGPGVIIIQPTIEAAEALFDEGLADADGVFDLAILWFTGKTQLIPGNGRMDSGPGEFNYAITVLQVGVALVSGYAEDLPLNEVGPRSIVNATALLDQLGRITAPPEGAS